MNRIYKFLFVISLVLWHSNSEALFINGGFETGDTYGWEVKGDASVISSFSPEFNIDTAAWNTSVPYFGSYSLLLGSPAVGNEWDGVRMGSIKQTGTVTSEDIANGLKLYFKWGAILEEPSNNNFHDDSEQPFFWVRITGPSGYIYDADHRANESGFTKIGVNKSGAAGIIWYGTGTTEIDLGELNEGDAVTIEMKVRDCYLGGHGGLVFLDGFSTQQTSIATPEPSTFLIFAFGIILLAACCRFKKYIF